MENEINNTENVKESKKKFIFNKKNILIAVSIIIGICIVILIGLKVYTSNPKTIYKSAINIFFEDTYEVYEELADDTINFDLSKDAISSEGHLKITDTSTNFDMFKGYKIDYKVGIDHKKDIYYLGAGLKENNKELVSALANILNDKIYIDLNELFDKAIIIDEDINIDDAIISEIKVNDNLDSIEYIFDKIPVYINNSIKDMEFNKEAGTIKLNDEKIKVNKNILSLSEKDLQKILNSILKSIEKDDKFISALESVLGISKNGIKTQISDMLDDINFEDNLSKDEILKITIYTTKLLNKAVGISLVVEDENEFKLIYKNGNYTLNSKTLFIEDTFIENEIYGKYTDDMITINIKDENSSIKVAIKDLDNDKMSVNINYIDATTKLVVDTVYEHILNDSKTKSNINMKVNIKIEEKTSNLNEEIEFEISNEMMIKNMLDNMDFGIGVNLEDLTQEDFNAIESNFNKQIEGSKLEMLLQSFGYTYEPGSEPAIEEGSSFQFSA